MQLEVIHLLMIEVCAEESVPPEYVFFYIVIFCCCLYHNDYSRKKILTTYGKAYGKSRGLIKKSKFLVVIFGVFSFKGLV